VWLIEAVVSLCAAPRVQCLLARAMDDRIMRRGIICSCQSAATSKIVKCFRSRVHVYAALQQVPDLYFFYHNTPLLLVLLMLLLMLLLILISLFLELSN